MDAHLLARETVGVTITDRGRSASRESARRMRLGDCVRKVYLWALFSLLLLGGATFILKSFHDVYYPFGWDDDEGAVWWEAAHVTNLRVLYHPIQQYPFHVVPYPPFFHLVSWGAAKIAGDFLIGGRLVSVLSAFGISLIFGLLVFHASSRRIPARVRGSGALLASRARPV